MTFVFYSRFFWIIIVCLFHTVHTIYTAEIWRTSRTTPENKEASGSGSESSARTRLCVGMTDRPLQQTTWFGARKGPLLNSGSIQAVTSGHTRSRDSQAYSSLHPRAWQLISSLAQTIDAWYITLATPFAAVIWTCMLYITMHGEVEHYLNKVSCTFSTLHAATRHSCIYKRDISLYPGRVV